MSTVRRPGTAVELRDQLLEIFPGFEEECPADDMVQAEQYGGPTLHLVMQAFAVYFGSNQQSFSRQQLTKLGALTNDAVTVDDNLENAFGTCFLEHLHQLEGYKTLGPFLSELAKRKTHP